MLLVTLGLLAGCGAEQKVPTALTRQQVTEQLARPVDGLPARARALERSAGTVLSDPAQGDATEQLAQIVRDLRGTPIVVNLWGEWCGPCKRELPIFQRVALQERGRVVFLGVASLAKRDKTEAYLRDVIALPFPSLFDEPGALDRGTGISGIPKTFFFDRTGKRTVHQGVYPSTEALLTDIERYAS